MALADHIADIQDALKGGHYTNEAAVSQGIVLRVLRALGWPVDETRVVWPEYSVEKGRVDFALCHPPAKPIVFVEVKPVGHGGGADRQLFEYAFHRGVPIAVLTDGQTWHFYLPAEQGRYEERRFYKLDLLERETDEITKILERYLTHQRICSGEALESARADYKDVSRIRDIEKTIPLAWKKLLEAPDDLLLDLISEQVEDLCGYKPDVDLVAEFLTGQLESRPATILPSPWPPTFEKPEQKPAIPYAQTGSGPICYMLKGKRWQAGSAREVLVNVLRQLYAEDRQFLERFAARPKHGRKRRYVARSREELYPGRADLASQHSYQLAEGWWMGTNNSKAQVLQILRMACEVAGLQFGTDLVVEFD